MNSYEMMYIIRPDMGEEQVRQTVDKYREFLTRYNCQDLQIKILGKKRLAYPIQKYQDGIYVQTNYQGGGDQVAPLERDMRLSEDIIRFLTIKLKPANPDAPAPASASLPVSAPAPSPPVPVSVPVPVSAAAPAPTPAPAPAPAPAPEAVVEPEADSVAEPASATPAPEEA